MNRRLTAVLLGIWSLVLVGSALAGAFGALGRVDDPDDSGAAAAIVFVGAFAVTFAVFFFVTRERLAEAPVWWWLIASLFPFVAASVPIGAPWTAAPIVAVALAFPLHLWHVLTDADDLQQRGVHAIGTVLEVIEPRFFNAVVNDVYIKRTVRVDVVRSDGGPAFEGKFTDLFMLGNVPDAGAQIALRVDPNNPKHFAPEVSGKRNRQEAKSRAAHHSKASRLAALQQMRSDGSMNEDEYRRGVQMVEHDH